MSWFEVALLWPASLSRWRGTRGVEASAGHATPRAQRRHSLTKVGLWLLLCVAILAIAGANTGNNALYMVVAALLGLLTVSAVWSRLHVRGLEVTLAAPEEIFASSPASVRLELRNRARWGSARQLLLTYGDVASTYVDRAWPRRQPIRAEQDALWLRRGQQGLDEVRVMSLFPLGLFRSVLSFRPTEAVLVYPQVFTADEGLLRSSTPPGEGSSHRRGRNGDLFGLREYRRGDDPRAIHWKRSASVGELVLVERQAEESRRVSLIVDNVLPDPNDERSLERFELLVSEAATLGLLALEQGFDVELVTRTGRLAFGTGPRQRGLLLRELALLDFVASSRVTAGALLATDPGAWLVRLAMPTRVEAPPAVTDEQQPAGSAR